MSKTARSAVLALQPSELNFTLEIGGQTLSLYARELTGAESDSVAEKSLDSETGKFNTGDFYNYRILACIYEQSTKKPLFADEDFDALKGVPARVLNKLRQKVSEANNDLTKEDVEAKKK